MPPSSLLRVDDVKTAAQSTVSDGASAPSPWRRRIAVSVRIARSLNVSIILRLRQGAQLQWPSMARSRLQGMNQMETKPRVRRKCSEIRDPLAWPSGKLRRVSLHQLCALQQQWEQPDTWLSPRIPVAQVSVPAAWLPRCRRGARDQASNKAATLVWHFSCHAARWWLRCCCWWWWMFPRASHATHQPRPQLTVTLLDRKIRVSPGLVRKFGKFLMPLQDGLLDISTEQHVIIQQAAAMHAGYCHRCGC